ncbi:MAG: LDCC motif putative metal-binding protein [Cyclobacteriaceae bacterium]
MEDFVRTLNLTSAGEIPEEVWNAVTNCLISKEGISFKITDHDSFSVDFLSIQYSPEYIRDIVRKAGFREKAKEKKSLWKRWLDSMASDTDSTFGTRRLDCCSLNRDFQVKVRRRPKYRQ